MTSDPAFCSPLGAVRSTPVAMHQKQLPAPLEEAMSGALRLATLPLHVAGLETSLAWARGVARLVPRVMPERFERAVANLRDAYPGWTQRQVRAGAIASYEHFLQTSVEFLFLPRLISEEGFTRQIAIGELAPGMRAMLSDRPCIMLTGHVGNWELVGFAISMLGFPLHAVYRPFAMRPLDTWVREGRARRGLMLVSKFGAAGELSKLAVPGRPLGLVADQTGGDNGIFVPFFGRLTSTHKSVALLAMQTGATLVCGYARRMSLAEANQGPNRGLRMKVELVDAFGPEDWRGQPDPQFYISARYRRAMETMVRRNPEQYLWMHRVWKARPPHERRGKPFPARLRENLLALPWMTPEAVGQIEAQSAKDAANLARFAP